MALSLDAEPPGEVVTEARPGRFHRCLQSAAAAKLPQPTTLFNPGMCELRDLRPFRVDLSRLFGLHFGLEGPRGCGFFDPRDGPPPLGSRFLRRAFSAVEASTAGRLRRPIDVRAHTVPAIQQRMMAERLSRRTGEAIPLGIVGKGAS